MAGFACLSVIVLQLRRLGTVVMLYLRARARSTIRSGRGVAFLAAGFKASAVFQSRHHRRLNTAGRFDQRSVYSVLMIFGCMAPVQLVSAACL